MLPPDKRDAIVAVWDFCRAVDDAVDEIAPDLVRGEGLPEEVRQQAAASLAAWRQELAAVYESQPSTPQGTALQPFVGRFNLPRSQCEALIDGVEMDLSLHRYPNFETLVQYCHRVASSVGLICVEIFGYEDPRTRDYAVSLGVALQLTNILLDWPADVRNGRCYLPASWLAEAGVTPRDLVDHGGPGTIAVARRLERKAREALATVPDYLDLIPSRRVRYRLFCLWPALWALGSLRHARHDPEFPWGPRRPKLPRSEVWSAAIASAFAVHQPATMRTLYERAAREASTGG